MPDKTYVGTRKDNWAETVTVNGQRLFDYSDPDRSDNGFEWGYEGTGPSVLALSILCDHFGVIPTKDHRAQQGADLPRRLALDFKQEVIATLPRDSGFTLTSDQIAEWIAKKESESRASTSPS